MNKKFLVTGFEPFAGDSLNPTQKMLDWIQEDSELSVFFETQLLPVTFESAHQQVLQRPDLDQFQGLIHFGLAAGRSKMGLERVALNWIETSIADNSGKKPPQGPIVLEEEKVFFTRAPLEKLKKDLESAGLPVEISLSAGGYVCNHLYFQMLRASLKPWVLFVHVPCLEEQVGKKPGTPFVREADLKKLLRILVQSLGAD